MQDEIPGFTRAMNLVANPYILATAAVVGFGAAFGSATRMANDWQEKMAHANVTANLGKKELGALSDQLLEIGARNVAPIEQVPDAFNKIISAGLDADTALKALEPTLRASKAGFTDIETTAAAAAGVMNASGRDINTVYDVLFATVNKGNAEFKDIAQYLPKIIPAARNAGFSLEETAGAWAYLTAQGATSERATTLMENAMKALTNPERAKAFKKMGIDIYDATGKMKPMTAIVETLAKKTAGLSDQARAGFFGKLGMDQEAASFFASATQDVAKFKETIDFTTNSAGQLEQAYKNAASPMDSWKKVINGVKGAMIKMGQYFLPIIGAIGDATLWVLQGIKRAFNWVSENADIFKGIILGVTTALVLFNAQTILAAIATSGLAIVNGVVTVATTAWTAAQWLLNAALTANPIGIVIVAIGALVAGFYIAYQKSEKFREVIMGVWTVMKSFGTLLKEYIINRIQGIITGLGAMGSALVKLFKGDFSGAVSDAKTGIKELSGFAAKEKMANDMATLYNVGKNEQKQKNKLEEAVERLNKNKKELAEQKERLAKLTGGKPLIKQGDGAGLGNISGNGKLKDTTDKVAGTAQQIRNITVNIDAFNKGGINTQNTNLKQMDENEIEKWFNEMMLRIIRNLEMSY